MSVQKHKRLHPLSLTPLNNLAVNQSVECRDQVAVGMSKYATS